MGSLITTRRISVPPFWHRNLCKPSLIPTTLTISRALFVKQPSIEDLELHDAQSKSPAKLLSNARHEFSFMVSHKNNELSSGFLGVCSQGAEQRNNFDRV